MAKNNNTKFYNLTITNSDFKEKLEKRIVLGEQILKSVGSSTIDVNKLHTEFELWNDYNIELLIQSFDNPDNDYMTSYRDAGYYFLGGIIGEIEGNSIATTLVLIKHKINELKKLVAKSDLLRTTPKTTLEFIATETFKLNDVFIVHGHDDLAKTKTARLIEKLGFNPIILHEQSNSGKTIIEKIEEYSNVGFGIILYTPCDIGGQVRSANLNNRARQNVVFEHGYLIGKIGRKNVCALIKDEVEVPNDISGVVYINMDKDDSWQLKVAKELRSSGYNVDLNLL